jgi:hypothetical protein
MSNRLNSKIGVIALISRAGISSLAAWAGLSKAVSLAGVALASAVAVHAQSNTVGYVYGQIQGVDLSGATVVVENTATGLRREATPDARGTYQVSSLPAGTYRVSIVKSGAPVDVRENVAVSNGSGSAVRFTSAASGEVLQMERFDVSGASISPIDVSQTEAVTVLREETYDLLPVARNISAVALLAPGTTQGDTGFGNLVSFGGSSVAENSFYVNGFNVTNFRNGLGGSTAPFEFYKEFQVKTGGYGAEFGRSTGGVINATTKRGDNTFRGGISTYFEADSLSSHGKNFYYPDTKAIYRDNNQDYDNTVNSNIYFSGPIIKDKLFIYGLYNQRNIESRFVGVNGTQYFERDSKDPFWGGKIDYQITNDHALEYTIFSDKRVTVEGTYDYDYAKSKIGDFTGNTNLFRGGVTQILRYSGQITDDFSISALYGKGEFDTTSASDGDAFPAIYDGRTGALIQVGDWVSLQTSASTDEREGYRLDGTYRLGSHQLRFGYDAEDNVSNDVTQYSGGIYWRYYAVPSSNTIAGFGTVPAGASSVVRERVYKVGGTFSTKTEAYYLEDKWTTLQDRLVVNVGVRNETFENYNKEGDAFVKVDDQIAPRAAVSYDLSGNGTAKVFANWGRYFLPVASNTNVRMAGGELFTEEYYVTSSINADFTPSKGAKIGNTLVYSNGEVLDARTQVNQDMKPMFQDEYAIGYQAAFNSKWSYGIRGIYRDLGSAMDDIIVNPGLAKFAARNKLTYVDPGFEYYILTNPGEPVNMLFDLDGDGDLEQVNLTAEDTGFPSVVRKYYAVEFSAERAFRDNWFFQGSYTWAHSYGNTEGYVNSDLDQGDAGITANFDKPSLTINTYGNLPNDRRHSFKFFGAYQFSPEVQVGANALVQSGRPLNKLGNDPTGAAGYAGDFLLVPRGGAGETPWTYRLDLTIKYKPKYLGEKVTLGLDVFNVFDSQRTTEPVETFIDAAGNPNRPYGLGVSTQQPRYTRLSFAVDF